MSSQQSLNTLTGLEGVTVWVGVGEGVGQKLLPVVADKQFWQLVYSELIDTNS